VVTALDCDVCMDDLGSNGSFSGGPQYTPTVSGARPRSWRHHVGLERQKRQNYYLVI
jgi:hypothetical protein